MYQVDILQKDECMVKEMNFKFVKKSNKIESMAKNKNLLYV